MIGPASAPGSRFAGDWLSLREAVDHRSRAHGLTMFAARHLALRTGQDGATVIDLGTGRGSNLRYLLCALAPGLTGSITWRLLDQDDELLAAAVRETPRHDKRDRRFVPEVVDLAAGLSPLLAGADLVTASAFLDLVSQDWIERFVAACARARAAVLVAVSIDGRIEFTDPDPLDTHVRAAIARDQARDKGFGPALGAAAPAALINALSRRGYAVTAQPSDWRLDADDAALARALIAGWQKAAASQRPDIAAHIDAWAERRTRALEQEQTGLRVGHVDVLGVPGRADSC